MNALGITGIVVGTLAAAWGLDRVFGLLFDKKSSEHTIDDFMKIADDLEPEDFKKRRESK